MKVYLYTGLVCAKCKMDLPQCAEVSKDGARLLIHPRTTAPNRCPEEGKIIEAPSIDLNETGIVWAG